jgi:hypothetical protein
MLQGVATPDADVDVSTLKHVLLDRFRATIAQRREELTAVAAVDKRIVEHLNYMICWDYLIAGRCWTPR